MKLWRLCYLPRVKIDRLLGSILQSESSYRLIVALTAQHAEPTLHTIMDAGMDRTNSSSNEKDQSMEEKGHEVHVNKVATNAIVFEIPHEVRAVVAETDDPETPCETFRAYFIGMICAVVGTALNQWFGSRQPGEFESEILADREVSTFHPWSLNLYPTPWAFSLPRSFHGVDSVPLIYPSVLIQANGVSKNIVSSP